MKQQLYMVLERENVLRSLFINLLNIIFICIFKDFCLKEWCQETAAMNSIRFFFKLFSMILILIKFLNNKLSSMAYINEVR